MYLGSKLTRPAAHRLFGSRSMRWQDQNKEKKKPVLVRCPIVMAKTKYNGHNADNALQIATQVRLCSHMPARAPTPQTRCQPRMTSSWSRGADMLHSSAVVAVYLAFVCVGNASRGNGTAQHSEDGSRLVRGAYYRAATQRMT